MKTVSDHKDIWPPIQMYVLKLTTEIV